MKKSILIVSILISVLMLTSVSSSSSLVSLSGTFENEHIKLEAYNRIASWKTRRGGGSSTKIRFTITAKPGYKLIGKYNRIVYYGIYFTFKPKNNEEKSFKKGYAHASGRFLKSSVFKLRYIIAKSGSSKRKFVRIKLKMIQERPLRGSHDNVKMIIKQYN